MYYDHSLTFAITSTAPSARRGPSKIQKMPSAPDPLSRQRDEAFLLRQHYGTFDLCAWQEKWQKWIAVERNVMMEDHVGRCVRTCIGIRG